MSFSEKSVYDMFLTCFDIWNIFLTFVSCLKYCFVEWIIERKTMDEVIVTLLNEHLYRLAVIVALCMASMIVAMLVDLIFGVRKAKANGEATTSTGLKKTCDKARKYFSPFMVTVCIDLIASCAGIPVPVFSMIWAVYCVFCEFMSVREKAWQKAEIRKQENTMRVVLQNRHDLANAIVEALRMQADDRDKMEKED